jgi:WD40 repeat protein
VGSGHVFVSYGRADRERARRLAALLDERGFDVWWDPKIRPGVSYDRIIERALEASGCVIVLWSADSVDSDWVRAEADEGRKRKMLVPVLVEAVEPPLQFRLIETIDLTSWVEGDDPPAIDRLAASVSAHVTPTAWIDRWRRDLSTDALHLVPYGPQPAWVSTARTVGKQLVVTAGGDGWLRTWHAADGSAVDAAKAHEGSAWCATGLPELSGHVVSGGADGRVRVGDLALTEEHLLEGHGGWVLACASGRGGRALASGSRDTTIRLWDTTTWTERAMLAGHRGAVWAVAFAADDDRVVSTSDDQTARVWSWRGGTQLCVMREHTAPVMACAILPDGDSVVSGGYDGTVLRWDLGSGHVQQRFEGSPGWVLSLAVAADGSLLIAGTSTGAIVLWDLRTGELFGTLHAHRGPVMSVQFVAGVGLLSASADNTAGLLCVRPFELA